MFWASDPSVLLKDTSSFFPTSKLGVSDNLNAIVRLSIYLSIVLVLYAKDPRFLLLGVGAMLTTFLIHALGYTAVERAGFMSRRCDPCDGKMNQEAEVEQSTDSCIQPTQDNPFMNFNYLTDDYHREPACKAWLYDDPVSQEVRKEVDQSFNHDLYRDVSDMYSKSNSQRQFYTMPCTSSVNDQTSFAKWLFRTGPTCKELGAKCAPYWDPTVSNVPLQRL